MSTATPKAPRQSTDIAPLTAYEQALISGDISGLDEQGRYQHYLAMCKATGLNPATGPFGYMSQWAPGGDKLVFYLKAIGAAQLRTLHGISITRVEDNGEVEDGIAKAYRWTVYGRNAKGMEDVEIGSVPLYKGKDKTPLAGKEREDARKKAFTQAKTRLTKSLTGVAGVVSEDEIDGRPVEMPRGNLQVVDTTTGEVLPSQHTPRQIEAAPVATVQDRGQANNYHDALYDTLAAAAHRHDGVERPALDLSVTSAEEVERSIKELIKTLVRLPAIAGDTGVAMTQAQVDTILALKGRYSEAGVILGSLPRMTEQGAAWLIDVLDSLAPLADESPI